MRFKLFIIACFLIILQYSCEDVKHKDRIKEGYIEYNIEYLDDSLDSFMIGLMPKKMTVKFKNNNTINKIEGFSGIISFTHIQNYKEKKNTTLIKVLNKKYQYSERLSDESLFFEKLPGLKIELQDTIMEICGFSSKKAKVTIPKSNIKPYFICFTNDIIINNANAQTPFKSLDGVLLEFQIKLYGMNMKLTAINVKEAEVSSDEFEIPKGYEPINRKTMIEIIELLKQ